MAAGVLIISFGLDSKRKIFCCMAGDILNEGIDISTIWVQAYALNTNENTFLKLELGRDVLTTIEY